MLAHRSRSARAMTRKRLPVPLGMLQGIECGKPESLSKLYDAVAALL